MLPVVIDEPFDSLDHIFEVKWGGVRAIARVQDGEVRLHGRNLRDLTPLYPELAVLARCLPCKSAVVDGEIVAWGSENIPSFDLLRQRLLKPDGEARPKRGSPIVFQAFDLLEFDGDWLLERPLTERRNLLHRRLQPHRVVSAADFVQKDGVVFFEAVAGHKLPGIVAKEKSSPYLPGRQSTGWQEIRAAQADDFVVGGYTFGGGRRDDPIASLLLGAYRRGRLDFVGEVSVGCTDREARLLVELLAPLHVAQSPFPEAPSVPRLIHWCQPELACHVSYGGWAPDGKLRFPVFVAPRPDVPAQECVLEPPR
ncbi:MAG: non-homologous end-joining DNA ligase [Dehalococcoidia bacterium]